MLERRRPQLGSLHSIRSKLFLLRIGIGVVMSFAIGTFCYFIIYRSIEEIREGDLNRDTDILIEHVREELTVRKQALLEIAKSDQVRNYFLNYSLNMIQSYLNAAATTATSFDSIGLVDADGKMEFNLVQGQAVLETMDLSTDPDYQRALHSPPGQTLVSDPRRLESLGGYGLVFDCLVTNFFDKRLSFVRGAINLTRIGDVFTSEKMADKIETAKDIFIVGPSGQIIYNSQNPDDLGQDIAKAHGLIAKLWADSRSFGEDQLDGYSYKFQRDVIPELGWQILVAADLKAWNKPIIRLRNQIILFALFIVVIGEIISRLVGLKITEPITRLNKLAQAIVHSGRLSDRVQWQSMDELGELAQSVNHMLDRLEESHNQLLSEKQFVDNVLASVIDGMAIGGVDEVIITTNSSLPSLLGYEKDELFTLPLAAILPPEALLTGEDGRPRIANLDPEHHFIRLDDTLAPKKNGEWLAVSCTISMIFTSDGHANGFLVILTDISERKRLELAKNKAENRLRETQEELLKTEKMAVVGQMSGMVAHEVLNPISAVKVRVDLGLPKAHELSKVLDVLAKIISDWRTEEAAGTLADYLTAKGKKDLALLSKISDTLLKRQVDRISDLEFLDRQILRIIKIIDNLREMSRAEKTIETIKLAQLLEEILGDMSDGLAKRQITVERDFRAQPTVKADYMEIYSIFSNLIKNGMQAIDKQPAGASRQITVRLDLANEQQSLVEITDTGIGMDMSQAEAIFTPGFTSKGRAGTGIGTSFARKLARQFGGDIILKESTPGQGSTFQVLLALGEPS